MNEREFIGVSLTTDRMCWNVLELLQEKEKKRICICCTCTKR
jgi:hypothetical protein